MFSFFPSEDYKHCINSTGKDSKAQEVCDLPRSHSTAQSTVCRPADQDTLPITPIFSTVLKLWLAGKRLHRWHALENAQNYFVCKIQLHSLHMTSTAFFWNQLKHIYHTEINTVQTKTAFQQHMPSTSKQLDVEIKLQLMPLCSNAFEFQCLMKSEKILCKEY